MDKDIATVLQEIAEIVEEWNNDTEKDLEAVTAMECITNVLRGSNYGKTT